MHEYISLEGSTPIVYYHIAPEKWLQGVFRDVHNSMSDEEFKLFVQKANRTAEAFAHVMTGLLLTVDAVGLEVLQVLMLEFTLAKREQSTLDRFDEIIKDFDV